MEKSQDSDKAVTGFNPYSTDSQNDFGQVIYLTKYWFPNPENGIGKTFFSMGLKKTVQSNY